MRDTPRRRDCRLCALVAVAACVVGLSSGAMAQQAGRVTPPTPTGELGDGFVPVALRFIVLGVGLGAVGFAAVFPSKRGHQD